MLDILKFSEVIIAVLLIFIVLIQNKNVSLNLSDMSGGM
jgi:preprotein translocase subunit SecG